MCASSLVVNETFSKYLSLSVVKLQTLYKGLAQAQVNDGASVLFWHDSWNSVILTQQCPKLFSFAKKPDITVQNPLLAEQLTDLFHLPV